MTKEQFIAKYNEMVDKEVTKYLAHKAESLAASGAIDWESYDDNYLLPKLALSVALKSLADEFVPLDFTKKLRDDARNFAQYI
jgi:hypothetical protein